MSLSHTEKQQVRRDLAASTLIQVGRLCDMACVNLWPPGTLQRQAVQRVSEGVALVAKKLQGGAIPETEWEFLSWLAEPRIDLDNGSPERLATSAEEASSGLKSALPDAASPSTLNQSPTTRTASSAAPARKTRKAAKTS
jgi:hypothetical protein